MIWLPPGHGRKTGLGYSWWVRALWKSGCVERALPDLQVRTCASCPLSQFRYIFLEYASPAHALDAVKNADGYKLDKQHTFRVNLFTDFDKWVLTQPRRAWAFSWAWMASRFCPGGPWVLSGLLGSCILPSDHCGTISRPWPVAPPDHQHPLTGYDQSKPCPFPVRGGQGCSTTCAWEPPALW